MGREIGRRPAVVVGQATPLVAEKVVQHPGGLIPVRPGGPRHGGPRPASGLVGVVEGREELGQPEAEVVALVEQPPRLAVANGVGEPRHPEAGDRHAEGVGLDDRDAPSLTGAGVDAEPCRPHDGIALGVGDLTVEDDPAGGHLGCEPLEGGPLGAVADQVELGVGVVAKHRGHGLDGEADPLVRHEPGHADEARRSGALVRLPTGARRRAGAGGGHGDLTGQPQLQPDVAPRGRRAGDDGPVPVHAPRHRSFEPAAEAGHHRREVGAELLLVDVVDQQQDGGLGPDGEGREEGDAILRVDDGFDAAAVGEQPGQCGGVDAVAPAATDDAIPVALLGRMAGHRRGEQHDLAPDRSEAGRHLLAVALRPARLRVVGIAPVHDDGQLRAAHASKGVRGTRLRMR